MTASAADAAFMARALQLARNGLYTTDPNPRVGCVLVRDGVIVGEGWHVRAGEGHAEYNALAAAGERSRGSTVYVTLEPCCHHGRTPPCTDGLIRAGVSRVVAAMQDPNNRVAGRGFAQLREAGIAVEHGLLEDEAWALNPGFIQRMTRGRPFVRAKLAMSLDGRTAMASGESQWITGEMARADVHHLRARSSAIMTGVSTLLADNPSLNARLPGMIRQPLRVILDPALETPPDARTLGLEGEVLILTAQPTSARHDALLQAGAYVQTVAGDGKGIDLPAALRELAHREVNEVHLECGAVLAGAMLRAGLLDEIVLYIAPTLLGDGGRGLFHLPGLEQMQDRIDLDIQGLRAVGQDWRMTLTPRY